MIPEFIFRQPPTGRDRDHRLRLMMAVPIAPEWGAAFEERFGVPFMQGFGMTECNIVAYTRPGDALVPGCAGYPLADWFDVAIADPATDALLPAGQTGEIVVRPKVPGCVMAGYFRMPEKTVEAWRNLWFHTGDAGRFDDAGRLHFVDRIKDCIRRRGENISSFEIEQVLNAHPAVAEAAVVGIKVAGAGGEDEVKAYVVPAAGAAVDPVALLDWCAPRMPHFAVPRFVEVVSGELAKTPTGKVQKTRAARGGDHRGHLGPRVHRLRGPAVTRSGPPGQPGPGSPPSIARGILDQARPIFVGQVAVMLYGVVDTVLTGHASATDLAAMGLGTGVYSSVFVSLLGVLNALNPIIGQHHGGGRHAAIGVSYVQGLWLALLLSVAGGLFLAFPGAVARLDPRPARRRAGGDAIPARARRGHARRAHVPGDLRAQHRGGAAPRRHAHAGRRARAEGGR